MLYKLLSLDPAPHSRGDIFVGRRAVLVVAVLVVTVLLMVGLVSRHAVSVRMHLTDIGRPAAHSTHVRMLHGAGLSEIIVPLGCE